MSTVPYSTTTGPKSHPKIKGYAMQSPKLLLGAHFSIAGGLQNAIHTAAEYGCTALQLFTKNSRTWKEREVGPEEIAAFREAGKKTGIDAVISHTAYLINLASDDPSVHGKSYAALKAEMIRSSALGIPWVVLHPGSPKSGTSADGIRQVIDGINRLFTEIPKTKTRLLLETTAGQGKGVGHAFEEIAEMADGVIQKENIGVCLDTCHMYAAGYDFRDPEAYGKTMESFDSVIGLANLYVIHINDAKTDLGSRVDRHEHIGDGKIGLAPFGFFLNDPRLARVPKILETPSPKGEVDWDRVNLERLRGLVEQA